MTTTATRYLYLARHGEANPDESSLTDNGQRQAVLLGERLRASSMSAIHHGPLTRATQTAELIGDVLADVPLLASATAGDYVPHVPTNSDLPPESAPYLLRFLDQFTADERSNGAILAGQALQQFTGPVEGVDDRHELVVTHNFLIGWLVRAAMDAPDWRWLGLDFCHTALTVIRYAYGRPPTVLNYNDMRHLPAELRWTGFPSALDV